MKGIILAAGYGSRFLPATKTLPKEMLPLINKPTIEFIIEEFLQSGIKDIIIITSRRKTVLDNFFDRDIELEYNLPNSFMKELKPPQANFCFIRQQEMKGTGHALLLAKPWIGKDPVVVAYPDDLHVGEIPLTKQLIKVYKETGKTILSSLYNPPNINRYGVLDLAEDELHVQNIVEKPPIGEEPSLHASIGRFLYTSDFFDYLEEGWENHVREKKEGEYFHIYALNKLMENKKVVYKALEGERWDIGEPSGYFKALLKYAKKDPLLKAILEEEKV